MVISGQLTPHHNNGRSSSLSVSVAQRDRASPRRDVIARPVISNQWRGAVRDVTDTVVKITAYHSPESPPPPTPRQITPDHHPKIPHLHCGTFLNYLH
ncbi:hypothetical protein J6590_036466 [Homalodisca vitripennis]|nr:hypothetical protein J6590_036466 [Homalodisca vitripennis]